MIYEISATYDREPEPEPIDETEVVEVIPPKPDIPALPTKISCGGQTCHVESRPDGYHVITRFEDTGEIDDGSWILDEAGYQRWLAFLRQLVDGEIQE